jgi:hypothetical protein
MKTKRRKKGDFTAFEEWDASMVPPQPEPASYRPDYMDNGLETPKPAQRAATPIALVRKPPARSSECLERTKPDSLKTA